MSLQEQENQINALIGKADENAANGRLTEASQSLKEASRLDADHASLREAWSRLQNQDGGEDVLELIRHYIDNGQDIDCQKALRALDQKRLSSPDAQECLGLLLHPEKERSRSVSLIVALLSRQLEVRKAAASRLVSDATGTFDTIYAQGDDAFGALASVTLDESVWPSKDAQRKAQQDFFRLCVALLMDAGVEHPERPMKALARQLTLSPDTVAGLADEDLLDVALGLLDLRLERGVRSQAMLVASKMLDITKEKGQEIFTRYITERVALRTNEDLILAFSAAAALFPVITAVAAKLFMTEGFVQQLVPGLEKNSGAAASGNRKSNTLEQAALELLSSACVDKACREAIRQYCRDWLQGLAEEREGTNKALAALVSAKVIGDTADNDVTEKLTELVLNQADASDAAIEGLAYTSLQPKVKEEIVANEELVKTLVAALGDRPSVTFGCLTTFSNLTAYRPVRTEEQKKMEQLKAYADASKSATKDDPADNNASVTARCKRLLDAGLVSALVACCKQTTSVRNIALVVSIINSLAKEQKHRARMAQQGAIRTLLLIRDRMGKTDKASNEASTIERHAAHALARLLISVNPAHVFTAALPSSSAVSAIVQLLTFDQESDERDLLPTFEALLALTNLASMDDGAPRDLIIRVAWTTLENQLLLSNNALVQRASVELVCNLMASSTGVAKFADGSKQASNRMHILLALADVEDFATRRAAGGALAMLTEWDAAVAAVLEKERGVSILLAMCGDAKDEIKHRGLVCLLNVVSAPGKIGARGVATVKANGGGDTVKNSLRQTKNAEVLGVGVEVLMKLQ